jgi:glycosidase
MNKIFRFLTSSLALILITATIPVLADGPKWWNDAVFYQILVRSFQDSSDGPLANDGIGDIQGMISRLDYLNDGNPDTKDDLGITAVWLLPMSEASSWAGYSVDDYEIIEQDYGTKEDFKLFIKEAHKRGIRVIVDLVLNHTSNKHAWYVAAQNPESFYHDFYRWADERPLLEDGSPAPNWHKHDNGKWIYGAFSPGIPDLDLTNPNVKDKMFRVARYWLKDLGVDGFRLDAIKFLVEDGLNDTVSTEGTHAWLREFQAYCKSINSDCFIVGEVWSGTDEIARYGTDQVDVCFQFSLSGAYVQVAGNEKPGSLAQTQSMISESFAPLQYAPFLSNHDMMRVMEQLDRHDGKMKVASSLLLTAPGVPFVFYGEEVGISGHDGKGRSPMQWTDGNYSGFSTVEPYRRLEDEWERFNVGIQTNNADSLLSHYRNLIAVRNEQPVLRRGDYMPLSVSPPELHDLVCLQDENPARFGYIVHDDSSVTFVFDPEQYASVTADGTTDASPLNPDSIEGVSVAGDFNQWTPKKWNLEKNESGTYSLRIPAYRFTLINHEFKFVINGNQWIEPPLEMPNRKHSGLAGESYNIVLKREPGTSIKGWKKDGEGIVFEFNPLDYSAFIHRETGLPLDSTNSISTVEVFEKSENWRLNETSLQPEADDIWRIHHPSNHLYGDSGRFQFLVNSEYIAVPSDTAINALPSGDGSPVYAFLRILQDEAALCIINPSGEFQVNYSITGLPESLTGWMCRNIFTEEKIKDTVLNSEIIKSWKPFKSLSPYSCQIIHLKKNI